MYKPDQGRPTRIAAFVLFVAAGFYSGYCWFYFSKMHWPGQNAVSSTGAVLLLAGLAIWGFMLAFKKPKSGEFLIDLDGELKKVVWPGMKPMFDPKTEAWGSTYVVIACTIIFTTIIFALDTILGLGIHQFLFKQIIFG